MDGVAALVAVEVRPDGMRADGLVIGEEGIDDGPRVGAVLGGDGDLDAVAGGEDQGFGDALAPLQIGQRGGERFFAERQPFAHLDGRRLVAHAGDEELHGFSSKAPSRACAAQVRAEKPTSATVMMAAFRPRHPAATRRNTSTR